MFTKNHGVLLLVIGACMLWVSAAVDAQPTFKGNRLRKAPTSVSPPSSPMLRDFQAQTQGACCRQDGTATGLLTGAEQQALHNAIQDEYKARATYAKVVDTFGEVRPFSNIIHAETRHIEALAAIYSRYNLTVPADTWYGKVPAFKTLKEACAAAAQAEIDNAALYEAMMTGVDNPDLIRVFTALRKASLDNHLPAFQRCSGRGAVQGRGQQRGRGWGRGGANRQPALAD